MNRYCLTFLGYRKGDRREAAAASVDVTADSDAMIVSDLYALASNAGFEEVIDYGIKRLDVYHRPHVSPKTTAKDGQEIQIVSLGEWVTVREWRDPRNHDTALSLLEQEAQHGCRPQR